MVDSRAKGARTETLARDMLRKHTKLNWERVPGSGALDPKHMLKGDLYVPQHNNLFCVEVKGYAEDHISSLLLTGKMPQIIEWWSQAYRQGCQVNKQPLLIFKHDRSKLFVAFEDLPSHNYRYLCVSVLGYEFFIALLEDWLEFEQPKFVA